ncbi:MAG: penicillin-binding protein 2, partial [Actinomycetota bacterium]|nr:penicillin-binding protein 2 [Actinomycetota bacterium]
MSSYGGQTTAGIDRLKLRLAVMGVLVVASFVALFSRLWFLQVLASEQYDKYAQENRVRFVYSEPSRGRILDREGRILVRNRGSNSVTIDKQVIDTPREQKMIFKRLSRLLDVPIEDLRQRFNDATVSPYKPVAVANDVTEKDDVYMAAHSEDFPGVDTEVLPIRYYPHKDLAAHILGYVGEISPDELKSEHFKDVRPSYGPGDLIGKEGVEYFYDRYLRGRPQIDKVIVNSNGDPVASNRQQEEVPGQDLKLSVDLDIQKITEKALKAGLLA